MISLLLFPMLTGCAPAGIWMLTIPYVEGDQSGEDPCDYSFDENFQDGYQPDGDPGSDDSAWTITETYRGADSIMFIHTEPVSGGGAVLIIGNTAFPGTASEGGWTFQWDVDTLSEYDAEHEDGYEYTSMESSKVTTTIDFLLPMFGDATGTVGGSSHSEAKWTETDEWDPKDNDLSSGQIPSALYLVYKENGDTFPQYNDPATEDCKESVCYIESVTDCPASESSFTAKHVDAAESNTYDGWIDNAQ